MGLASFQRMRRLQAEKEELKPKSKKSTKKGGKKNGRRKTKD